MKIVLFGKRIPPACRYCEHGKLTGDTVLCRKRGTVQPDGHCRSYEYAPLRRLPKRAAPLPKYEAEEFKL